MGLKIDIFPHICPPTKYKDTLLKALPSDSYWRVAITTQPALFDIELRMRMMDKFEGLKQVLTVNTPSVEMIADPKTATELAKVANDEMAELVNKYPEYFVAAVAILPMNDMDAALKETDRAIKDLRFRGVQIYTPINDKPLDSPEFLPLFEKMHKYNLPIWIHPYRYQSVPDYKTETESKYRLYHHFGWPYETSIAMARLVLSGIMEKFPGLKIITHHCGAMIPFFAERIRISQDMEEMRRKAKWKDVLSRPLMDYFKMFYNDTAIYGWTPGLMCAYAFFGAKHLLFGTDYPYDNENGERFTRETIRSIEEMDISDEEKKMIFEDNARELLDLPV